MLILLVRAICKVYLLSPTSSPDSGPATDCYDLSNVKPFKFNINVCKKVYILAVYIRGIEYSFGLCSVAIHSFLFHIDEEKKSYGQKYF